MSILDALLDMLRPDDVIDSYFVQSDLKEIYLTDKEITDRASFDSLCNNIKIDDNIPIGKQVK